MKYSIFLFLFSLILVNTSFSKDTNGSQINSQTWLSAGPIDLGGITRVVKYDRTNPNIIITAGVAGGIWRSVDGGQSWVRCTGTEDIYSITTMIQDPRPDKNNIWYCAGGEHDGSSASNYTGVWYAGNGIFKSTDNGVTWLPYGNTNDNKPQEITAIDLVTRLAIDPTSEDDVLYAACVRSMLKISENGTKIEAIPGLPFDQNQNNDIIITPSGKFYVTMSTRGRLREHISSVAGIYYSENGENWENISPEFLKPSFRIVLDYAPSNENILYFFSSDIKDVNADYNQYLDDNYTVFKLEIAANQRNWTKLVEPIFESKNHSNKIHTQGGILGAIKVSPTDPNLVVLGGDNYYISYDGFATQEKIQWIGGYNPEWNDRIMEDTTKSVTEIYAHMFTTLFPTGGIGCNWIEFNPANTNEIIRSGLQGIYKLADISESADKTWIGLNNGLNITEISNINIDKTESGSDKIVAAVMNNGTYANLADKDIFNEYLPGSTFASYLLGDNSMVVSSYSGQIFRLDLSNGMVYSGAFLSPSNIQELKPEGKTVYDINAANKKQLAYASIDGIAICDDITLQDVSEVYHNHIIPNLNAKVVKFANSPETVLYVATGQQTVLKVTDLSANNFAYDTINLPNLLSDAFIIDLWISPNDNDNIIVVVSDYNTPGLIETKDGGKTWSIHEGNLEVTEFSDKADCSFRKYERLIYGADTLHLLGTTDGLYSTTSLNGFNTEWIREGENSIGRAVISDIEVRELDGRIVIATIGSGIFQTNYATSVEDFDGKNFGFAVSEVYPNPATSQINFVINTDNISFVEVKLLDLNGNKLANLISEEFTGTKNINYNIINLAAGTYFLHISDGNNFITKKVNVVR